MIKASGFAPTAYWKRSILTSWMKNWIAQVSGSDPYVLDPPTKQGSIRLPVGDLELARRLSRRKGVPKYQTYIKTLLHEALVKEAAEE